MKVETLVSAIGADFYTGVPDSQLKALCNYLVYKYGTDSKRHVIAANEGNCTAVASGYYLATGKIPVVYMQNSGEGNIINPVASLTRPEVYGIPMAFIIGWRGEPGVHDEPQHVYQGKITLSLLEEMGITSFIIDKDTSEDELLNAMKDFRKKFERGESVAFIVRKGALSFDEKVEYVSSEGSVMTREEVISRIIDFSGDDAVVSTTGKASRELFELREAREEGHGRDLLTVGSMGHCSSIAFGIAAQKSESRVWCVDGDGAALMHMGAMAVIGRSGVKNMIHVIVNNGAHETVGGMPTAARTASLAEIALSCGYDGAVTVSDRDSLDEALNDAVCRCGRELRLIEAVCRIGSRDDLGRPTTTAMENRNSFMDHLKSL